MPFASVTIPFDPVAIHLGPLAIHWYGIGYVVAILVGYWYILRYAARRGVSEDVVNTVAFWAIPAGLIGGRLYYVVQNDPVSYLKDPYRVLQVWHGGMAFFGAILAVLAVVVAFSYLRRLPLLPMLDIAAMFALLGQPIGRLGNVVNGDIVGPPTTLPWGFIYTHPDSFAPNATTAYHPAAVYEIIANLALIAGLFPLRDRLSRGGLAAAYLAGYCLTQLVVFIWRSEPEVLLGLQQAQVTAIVLLALEAIVLAGVAFYRRRNREQPLNAGDGSVSGVPS
ncbi:MAG: prolipoprotein diacylglyceryl transferase [Dehalococcoidia bacterium]